MVDAQERELIRNSLEQLLVGTSPRRIPEALLANGWVELMEANRGDAIDALFRTHGRLRIASAALDLVALDVLGVAVAADVAVVYPPMASLDSIPEVSLDGDSSVEVHGLALRGLDRADRCITVVADHGRLFMATVERDTTTSVLVGGLDPDLGLSRVDLSLGMGDIVAVDHAHDYVPALQRCLAFELLGLAELLLGLTIEHVSQREQFGHPLGVLQTVKHRIADMVVAIEAAQAVVEILGDRRDAFSSRVAKALAGRAATGVAKHAQQLGGAIGFTEESPLPSAIRRVHMLDSLLGSSAWLEVAVGQSITDERRVPRLFHL